MFRFAVILSSKSGWNVLQEYAILISVLEIFFHTFESSGCKTNIALIMWAIIAFHFASLREDIVLLDYKISSNKYISNSSNK